MATVGLSSVSYHLHMEDLDHPKTSAWFLNRVLEHGLHGCFFDPRHLEGWDERLVMDIGAFCAEHELYFHLGSGGFDFDRLRRRLEVASEAGASVLKTFMGSEVRTMDDEQRNGQIASAVENFKRLADLAEKQSVVLAICNSHGLTAADCLQVLQAVNSPFFKVCIDTGNPLQVWEEPVEVVEMLAPYAAVIHLKDWRLWWDSGVPRIRGCALGQGDVGIEEVYSVARANAPDVPVTLVVPCVYPDNVTRNLNEEEANVVESLRFINRLDADLLPT